MLININQWHASNGIFYGHAYAFICKLTKLKLNSIEFFISYFLPIILCLLLLLHCDIESKPVNLRKIDLTYFLLCHFNVNSFVAHKKYLC